MAPVSTAPTRHLRLQKLCYAWIHLPASERTAAQVTHTYLMIHKNMAIYKFFRYGYT